MLIDRPEDEARLLVDEDRRPGRFLVLGSATPDLVGLAAESLAGRVTLLEFPGLRVSAPTDPRSPPRCGPDSSTSASAASW